MAEFSNVPTGHSRFAGAGELFDIPFWQHWIHRLSGRHVPQQVLAVFWRQLALMIDVGVPLLKALNQVAERTSHTSLQRVIQRVGTSIEGGNSLSDALAQHPLVFSKLTIQIIQVAERGGVLDDSVRLVADELERHVEIQGKVRRVLAYPATLLLVSLLVIFFVLVWVIPEFTTVFASQNVELPWATRFVIGGANFLASYWWLCLLGGIVVVGLWMAYIRTPHGRLIWDRFLLRLPLIGGVLVKANVLRFAQTFGTLLRGGVPILASLRLVQEHAENSVLAGELAQVYTAVDQGSRLEVPLRQSKVFPPLAVDILAVGEEAGQLDTVLFKLAETYKEDMDRSISIFSSILEPLLLLLMGIFAAILVWAVYLPYLALPGLLGA